MEGKSKFTSHKQNISVQTARSVFSRDRRRETFCAVLWIPPQMSCPTSSVSLLTRMRPNFHSTPSHHCRFEASVWIQSEVYNLVNFTDNDKVTVLLRCSPRCWSSVENPGQQRMMGDFMWRTDFIFISKFGWALVPNTCSQCHSFPFFIHLSIYLFHHIVFVEHSFRSSHICK